MEVRTILAGAGAAAGFAAFWILICLLIARLGGWARLAADAPATGRPSGAPLRFQSAAIGGARYSNCVTLCSAPEGLYLEVMFLFRPGHPAILVPWHMIANARRGTSWRGDRVTLDAGNPPAVQIELPAAALAIAPIQIA